MTVQDKDPLQVKVICRWGEGFMDRHTPGSPSGKMSEAHWQVCFRRLLVLMPRKGSPVPKPRLFSGTCILLTAAAGVLLVGCSASVHVGSSTPKMSADKLATTVAEKLAATTGQPKPDISCPEDLAGKVGTTTRCKLTADDGSTLGVTVTVTSVDGDQINFDIKADDTASPAAN